MKRYFKITFEPKALEANQGLKRLEL